MKILYLDCGMGVAGDMLTAALYELLDERAQAEFIAEINALGIPGVSVAAEKKSKCGITGTHMTVTVYGQEEGACDRHADHGKHEHHDNDDHVHEHNHHGVSDIKDIIDGLNLSDQVRKNAISVYNLIARAESTVHGTTVKEIHFHELGNMDAIADVVSVCMLMEKLEADSVFVSPVRVGTGYIRCAHGILPVPAPATALLLKDVPIYSGDLDGEFCTPTGAALIKYFATAFDKMPDMKIEAIGYGMGNRDYETANCVRAILGELENGVIELSCNIDDMTGECIGFAVEKLFKAGALDVYTIPIGMKKSRPGILLRVMCNEEDRENIINTVFRYTTTLGIRESLFRRYTMERSIEKIQTEFGEVRVKKADGYGVHKEKYEYDDLARIADAEDMTIDEVIKIIDASK